MATGGSETDKLSDETFDLLCTVCKQEGKNKEADKFCTDCSDYYCLKCVKVHDTVPILKGHKITDKGQFHPGSTNTLSMVPTERCDKHGLKPVDMYCQNHDDVGCATCMAAEHRLCKDTFYIPEYIKNTKYVSNSQDMQRNLQFTEKDLTESLRKLQQEKQNTMQSKTGSIENIRRFRKEINQRLDAMEKKSTTEIEDKCKVITNKLEVYINAIQEMKTIVKSVRDKLENAGNNVSQVFTSTKIGQAVIQTAKQINDVSKLGSKTERIGFKANQKLVAMLEELKSLGKENEVLLQIKEMIKYPVKVESDTRGCEIISSCYLDDGTVILADVQNGKLKRLDRSSYFVRDHFDLPRSPWQVCAVNYKEVAVSYSEPEIMFVSLGNTMKQKFLVKTDFKCCSLAYANASLFISDYITSVYIYSASGEKLKQLSKDESGNDLFSPYFNIRSLCVNRNGSKIFVADQKYGLVILDSNAQVVGKFSCQKLKKASSVHLAANGTLLVSGSESNNVLQYGIDGDLIGEVIKSDGKTKCRQTACCSQDMRRLIVGGHRDEIEVYDLV